MHLRIRLAWLLVAPVLIGGCQLIAGPEELPSAAFTISQPSFIVGDTVVATLVNTSEAESLSYNLCFTALDRHANGDWQEVSRLFGVPSGAYCTSHADLLAPGARAGFRQEVSTDLPAGSYRLRTTVGTRETGARGGVVTTAAFTIMPPSS